MDLEWDVPIVCLKMGEIGAFFSKWPSMGNHDQPLGDDQRAIFRQTQIIPRVQFIASIWPAFRHVLGTWALEFYCRYKLNIVKPLIVMSNSIWLGVTLECL